MRVHRYWFEWGPQYGLLNSFSRLFICHGYPSMNVSIPYIVMHSPLFRELGWWDGGSLHILHLSYYVSPVPNPCWDFVVKWDSTKNEEYHYRGIRRNAKLWVPVGVSDVQPRV